MKKFTFFGIAILLHIIVILLSGFLISRSETNLEYKNLIPVRFNTGTFTTGGKTPEAQSAIPPRSRNKIEITETPEQPATEYKAGNNGAGKGTGTATGIGGGHENGEIQSFDSTVTNYQGPIYPRVAQVRGLHGSVKIKIIVSPDGIPTDFSVIKSSGHPVLDQAALDVVPRWRFQKKNSAYALEKTIDFQLKN